MREEEDDELHHSSITWQRKTFCEEKSAVRIFTFLFFFFFCSFFG